MLIETFKNKQRIFYKKIGFVYSPALNDFVYFTSRGFQHLLYKKNRKPRNIDEQYFKLAYLKYAPIVIINAHKIFSSRVFRIKGENLKIEQISIVYEIKPQLKIRVIIQKLGKGNYNFLSVMPHDKATKKKHIIKKR